GFPFAITSSTMPTVRMCSNMSKIWRGNCRVGSRGYLEFPTVHYEYLYNFVEHINLVAYKDSEILWIPIRETTLGDFGPIQQFLRKTLESGYDEVIQAMKESFFQGFEWNVPIRTRRDIR